MSLVLVTLTVTSSNVQWFLIGGGVTLIIEGVCLALAGK